MAGGGAEFARILHGGAPSSEWGILGVRHWFRHLRGRGGVEDTEPAESRRANAYPTPEGRVAPSEELRGKLK